MARYKDAIDWIAYNDDTEWVAHRKEHGYSLSVTACLVADLFGKKDEEIATDIEKALKRIARESR